MKTGQYRVCKIFLVWVTSVAIVGLGWWVYRGPRVFDGVVWRNRPTERSRMIEDLLRGERLMGKTRKEVVDLLGEGGEAKESALVYRVGSDGLIDDVWLEVVFEGDVCREARAYPD